jgi:NADH:ubiquinone oxidoreductase subunit 4 (subunit M)
MSLGLIGLFSFSIYGIRGFYLMLFGHAFVSAGLFFIAGMLYNRFGTRLLKYYSGIRLVAPNLAFFSFFFIIANIGFPGSLNFLCEIFILISVISTYNFFFIGFFGICFCYSLLYSV